MIKTLACVAASAAALVQTVPARGINCYDVLLSDSVTHMSPGHNRTHIELKTFRDEIGNRNINVGIDMVDPNNLLDHSTLLHFAATQELFVSRLRFLIARFNNRHVKLVLTIDNHRTYWRYVPRVDLADSPIEVVYQGGYLSEHPDLAFIGFTTPIFFDELRSFFQEYRPKAAASLELRVKEIAEKIHNHEHVDSSHRRQHGYIDQQELENSITNILFLRTAWLLKRAFVENIAPALRRDLRSDLRYLETNDDSVDPNEETLKTHFIRFYDLDPWLVSLVWNEKMADGWEFPLINPPRLRLTD